MRFKLEQPQFEKTFESWRTAARDLVLREVHPEEIHWHEDTPSLFSLNSNSDKKFSAGSRPLTVSADFLSLAKTVSFARDEGRWALLYRILFRLRIENPNLLQIAVDPDVLRAQLLKKSVSRDIHKMHAFVRFKKSEIDGEELYLAWHKPEHLIVHAAAPFFVRRFGDRRWSIFTPDESAHWNLETLTFGPGMEQHAFQTRDEWDEVWKTYYKSIFNPARIKVKAMKAEMAPKYWSSMPESALIPELIRDAPARLQSMAKNHREAAVVDPTASLKSLKESAKSCKACPLYKTGTQTVFGSGQRISKIMIIGEQPGDQEDLAGLPFVGPAGKVLMKALADAGVSVDDVYLTNAVKHFKWTPQGKRRLHQKPNGREMNACKPWLEAEIAQVKPEIIIALGATAGTAVLGRLPKISTERGRIISDLTIASAVIVTWHPSAVLRSTTDDEARRRLEDLRSDIELAAQFVRGREN